MRFYYASIFSQLLWGVYCVVAVPIALLIWKAIRGKLSVISALCLATVVAVLPWTEEWWIAFRFNQLCEHDAGIFITKVVETDGFFDSDGASLELVKSGTYRFIEGRDSQRGFYRLEAGDTDFMQKALARYDSEGKARSDVVRVMINSTTEALVFPQRKDSWRITYLSTPTARYHLKTTDSARPVAHQITRGEKIVLDTQTNEVIGRYTDYGRGPYWFFIHLDAPTMGCREAKGADILLYPSVLRSAKK